MVDTSAPKQVLSRNTSTDSKGARHSKKRTAAQVTRAAQDPELEAALAQPSPTSGAKRPRLEPPAQSNVNGAAVPKEAPSRTEETRKEVSSARSNPIAKLLKTLTSYTSVSVGELAAQVNKEIDVLKTRRQGEEVICPICQCDFFDDLDYRSAESLAEATRRQEAGEIASDYVVMMQRCKDHFFHLECLEGQLGSNSFLECSTCMLMYGVKTGDQPPGAMTWSREQMSLPGYPGSKTWVIEYSFSSGVHPETKKKYHGDGRTGYIPDSEEGREILALLVECFRRRLTFTVGFSVVRGRDNCIVWNGVHHKTRTHGGATNYGYPDDTYLNRVRQEMALKGVVFDSEEAKQAAIDEVTEQISVLEAGFKSRHDRFANFKLSF